MPKYCSFWWLLDDEKGFSVCRFCVFFVSVRCFSCIGFTFFVYLFYVSRVVFRCFLNTGFAFFMYGLCIFRVRILHFFVYGFRIFRVPVLCFSCTGFYVSLIRSGAFSLWVCVFSVSGKA